MKVGSLHSTSRSSSCFAEQRKLPSRARLFGLASFAALALLSAGAQAACKGGFCVDGRDDPSGMHVVTFTTTLNNFNHFNVGVPGGPQMELGENVRQFSFRNLASGTVETFSLQACSGGGLLQKSRCSPWAYFTHTAP